ncbi:hypothetical protein [Bacillus sp. FJAT-26390]|uniref:hypothetical protein n=1 Tax=Bacillus sp. FJAT-26390 TaxID=1743142 RepID=UPI0008080AD7|nr:hypothetical protein [Bacillus sp. FJAT-26390]OBZ13698.1 hypothetical protein A7975_12860 [Bacillus sp. FJAT-26390]
MKTSLNSALRRLRWGLVIAFLDIRIGYVDILPDFIGYMMIASALHAMSTYQPVFNKAKWIAIVLVVVSMPNALIHTGIFLSDFTAVPIQQQLYAQALLGLHVVLAYLVFEGLGLLAKQDGQEILLDSVRSRKCLYMVILAAQLIFYPFLLNLDKSWISLFILLALFSFIAELHFVRLPFRFSKK